MRKVVAANRLSALPALVFALLLTACTAEPAGDQDSRGRDNAHSNTKNGTGEVRHELEPLTSRFPQLVGATSATWMSGTTGDPRVPGPSTYWIDAIVELPEAEHAGLLRVVSATERPLPEDFSAQLHGAIPAGQLLSSAELDERFSQGGRASEVYVVTDGRTLILSTLFR